MPRARVPQEPSSPGSHLPSSLPPSQTTRLNYGYKKFIGLRHVPVRPQRDSACPSGGRDGDLAIAVYSHYSAGPQSSTGGGQVAQGGVGGGTAGSVGGEGQPATGAAAGVLHLVQYSQGAGGQSAAPAGEGRAEGRAGHDVDGVELLVRADKDH